MDPLLYKTGVHRALTKLGIALTFDNPEQAEAHYRGRQGLGKTLGGVGLIGGGLVGGSYGGAKGGPVGALVGSALGAGAGNVLFKMPFQALHDAQHRMRQRARSTSRGVEARLNMAGGLPSGLEQRF